MPPQQFQGLLSIINQGLRLSAHYTLQVNSETLIVYELRLTDASPPYPCSIQVTRADRADVTGGTTGSRFSNFSAITNKGIRTL